MCVWEKGVAPPPLLLYTCLSLRVLFTSSVKSSPVGAGRGPDKPVVRPPTPWFIAPGRLTSCCFLCARTQSLLRTSNRAGKMQRGRRSVRPETDSRATSRLPCPSPPQRHAAPLSETRNATTESAACLCNTHLRHFAPAEVPARSNLGSEPLALETPKSPDWS